MKSPFKFLDSYTKDDREIFFGRDREIKELYQSLFESNIMLVYGISGTGKSSLIHCGLANKINEADWLPVPVRRGSNIIESMAEGIRAASITPQQTRLLTAADFKKGVRSLYLDYYKLVFFIFDQFEELFIFGDKDERREFIQIVKSMSDRDLHCHFIFIMREEYMAGITEFEKYIPTIFSNRVRIEKMSHQNAAEAVKGPCKVFNINLEDGFAEALLEKLSPGSEDVELTYLQVFLDKIFRLATGFFPPPGLAPGEASVGESKGALSFTLPLLEKTGNVTDLLGSFLDEQISQLPNPEFALTILKAFVSARGTKRPANAEEVREYALSTGKDIDEKSINDLLNSLVNLRILQDKDHAGRNELRHDALASKIFEKITLVEKELLEIRQLIENAFHDYQKRGVLLSEDDLQYIAPYESRLFLPESHKKLIEKSKSELLKAKHRRRNIFSAAAILLILVLSGFTIWAIKERKNAIDKEGIANEERIKATASEKAAITARDNALESDRRAVASEKEAIKARDAAKDSETRALYEKTIAEKREIEARANNFNYLSKEVATDDPTLALRLAEYALSLDPDNMAILNNLYSIYDDNSFYKVFFRNKADELCRISPDWTKIAVTDGKFAILSDLNGNNPRILIGHLVPLLMPDDVHGFAKMIYDRIISMAFSPDGTSIITGSNDRTARLWDMEGNLVQTFRGHSGYIRALAFSNDGSRIVTGSRDLTVRLWDRQGNCLKVMRGHKADIYSAAFSGDGKNILTGSADSTAILWDLDGNIIKQFRGHTNIVRCVAFGSDGKTVLTGSNDKTARLWQIDGNILQVFTGHTDNIMSIAFSPDGKTIMTGSADRSARLWDLKGNTLLILKGHGSGVNSVVFSPDGSNAMTYCVDGFSRRWDLSQSATTDFTGHTKAVGHASFFPDGKKILTFSEDMSLKIWDPDGTCRQTIKTFATSVAVSPDGKAILIGFMAAQILDLEGKVLKTFTGHAFGINSVAYAPDGKTFVTGGVDKTARLWDPAGKALKILTGHSGPVNTVAFSPDSKKILTGADDNTAILWDLEGNLLQVFEGHNDIISSVCFSPDGKTILTASADKTARLWDLNGKTLQVMKGHTLYVNSATYSPDGQKIITGSDDNTARIWDLKGNTIQIIRGFKNEVYSVVFSPDGKKVLIGLADNTARLIELKKPVEIFLKDEDLEKLSHEQALHYGIIKLDDIKKENDIAILFEGLSFCLSQSKLKDIHKEEYLDAAGTLLRKTANSISNIKFRRQFISYSLDLYAQKPQSYISDKVEEANRMFLSASTKTDLRNAYEFYSEKCSKLDSVSVSLNLHGTFIRIAEKLLIADTSARKTISVDMAGLSLPLLQNREFNTSLEAINLALRADSTNQFTNLTLPLVLVLNNRFEEAGRVYLEYYKSPVYNTFYGSYKQTYLKDIDDLEKRGITHPDFEKVRELLNK
jgi:WD40 repeat protein